jgi:hypothetical protein
MSSGLHDLQYSTSVRLILHASIALVAGMLGLVLAAFGTGSMEMLTQYTIAMIHSVEPQLDPAYSANAVLLGLLLDAIVGVAISLLVFNRLHFHRWLPKNQAAR